MPWIGLRQDDRCDRFEVIPWPTDLLRGWLSQTNGIACSIVVISPPTIVAQMILNLSPAIVC